MSIRTATVFFCFVLVFSTKLLAQQSLRIIMEQEKAVAVSFKFSNDSSSWKIYRADSEYAIAGRQEVRSDSVLFRPVIPFRPGGHYYIKQHGITRYEFRLPEVKRTKPRVVHIFPSADSLPSNLLKFYIRFSEPISEKSPYEGIHMFDSSGDTLKGIFLEQEPALWNRERTILSLWLDPGRIKRNLELNKRHGTPLEAGSEYRLVIDNHFESRKGEPLIATASKVFRTGPPDRTKPTPVQWHMDKPKAASREPLRIHFTEYMDFLSTDGRIDILKEGDPLPGVSNFSDDEQLWSFHPEKKWTKGTYTIRADARMEDLAGNNLNKLFDSEISKKDATEQTYYVLRLTIE